MSKRQKAPQADDVRCVCGASMHLRSGRYGAFFGCSTYPECRATRKADRHGKPIGTVQTEEEKLARADARQAFYEWWTNEEDMDHDEAVAWLHERYGKDINTMSVEECDALVEELE